MNNQPKVTKTRQYSDSQGQHIVTEGQLLIIKKKGSPLKLGYFSPYIISKEAPLQIGDLAYFAGDIITWSEADDIGFNEYAKTPPKILALPEQFTHSQLQAIVDGKIKNYDGVLIKCEKGGISLRGRAEMKIYDKAGLPYDKGSSWYNMHIHVDSQNHITIFPAPKELHEALDELTRRYAVESNESYDTPVKLYRNELQESVKLYRDELQEKSTEDFKAGVEWATKQMKDLKLRRQRSDEELDKEFDEYYRETYPERVGLSKEENGWHRDLVEALWKCNK